jgi:sterol 3beta-glucosyltransferase
MTRPASSNRPKPVRLLRNDGRVAWAAVPGIVIPFSKDQPFWARQVKALGVGPDPIPRNRLTAGRLAHAMRVAVTDEAMRKRAAALGETIRAEDGVGNAVRLFNRIVRDHF